MIELSRIPKEPGCYMFKDGKGRIIYIGKAICLHKRVSSYFSKKDHDIKTESLVKNIRDIDFLVTNTEVEALILENNLVKRHRPKYNILLKDAKRFAYLQITDEEVPRVLLARKRDGKGKYIGPFTTGSERDYVQQLVINTFKLRTCRRLPKKPCLRYHIKLCTAPCAGYVTREQYMQQISDAEQVLRGRSSALAAKLTEKMKDASRNQEYETAAICRDQIRSLEYLRQRQAMERNKSYDEDIVGWVVKDDHVYLMLFNIDRGMLINKQEFEFELSEDFLDEFLTRYYSDYRIPREIILPELPGETVMRFIEERKKSRVAFTVPKIGEKKQLLELVEKNIEISFFGDMGKIEEIRKKLKLHELPVVIECFDISHLSGTSMVGSMVQFRNAKPDKSNYRRFRIKTVEGIDDLAAIAEVVGRRYKRLKQEAQQMPNLVIIDGGKGQLSAAIAELEKLEIRIPMISIAKRFEEIYFPGSRFPLSLKANDKAQLFIQSIRDEAHRFAISYNRLLRSKKMKDAEG